jgi:glycerol-3-phosphate dehydrogenase
LAERTGFAVEQVRAVWELYGTQTGEILAHADGERTSIPGTDLPRGVVRWLIEHEWVHGLDDLVERRLMLLYDPRLSETTLRALAELLVESKLLSTDQIDGALRDTVDRLRRHFGKKVLAQSLQV